MFIQMLQDGRPTVGICNSGVGRSNTGGGGGAMFHIFRVLQTLKQSFQEVNNAEHANI